MKFKCISKFPVAVVVDGDLTLVREGEIIDVEKMPLGGFVAVEPPKPVKRRSKKLLKR